MSLRRLVPSDASAYRSMMLEAYARHPDAFTSTAAERAAMPLSWWESRIKDEPNPAELVLGAFRQGRLAALGGLSFETREKARHKSTLFGMYVAPEFRKTGLGRELVLAALDHARSREGVRLVQLTVTHGNDVAQTLYEECGFIPFGLEPLAIAVGPTFVSKVHMWCDLRAGIAQVPA